MPPRVCAAMRFLNWSSVLGSDYNRLELLALLDFISSTHWCTVLQEQVIGRIRKLDHIPGRVEQGEISFGSTRKNIVLLLITQPRRSLLFPGLTLRLPNSSHLYRLRKIC